MITLYFLVNARMPTEKAHGVQLAKMCEAFIEAGISLVLVLPRRENLYGKSVREFYSLRVDVPTRQLWSLIERHNGGPLWYYLTSISFRLSYFFYFLFTVDKKHSVIYTVDIDNRSYSAMRFLGMPFFSEMHGAKPNNRLHHRLFAKMTGVIPTTTITKAELAETFRIPDEKFLVEPNGVDLDLFKPMSKDEARKKLSLPPDMRLSLYVGRFFEWKGLGILVDAAESLKEGSVLGLVGDSAERFKVITGRDPHPNMKFFGDQPYPEIPLWIAAADVLLVLGTKKDVQSYKYTSPMKVFEYMAAKRPIVASETPALKEVLTKEACYFYEPDNAEDLAQKINEAIEMPGGAHSDAAYAIVARHTWGARARRIREFMNKRLTDRNV
jgi:glycosyltransferase involved in cell wall biosynthesis